MRIQFFLFAIFLALFARSTLAQVYSVTGVDDSDTLNVRSRIGQFPTFSKAPVVGTIPPDADHVKATGVSIELNGTLWREIRYGSVSGWVNDHFLKLSTYPTAPTNLFCFGTEPFWGIEVNGDTGRLTGPEFPDAIELSLLAQRDGLGRRNLWVYYLQTVDNSSVMTALLEYTDACSDGMSDFTYAYDLYLLGLRPGEGPAHGCCTTSRLDQPSSLKRK